MRLHLIRHGQTDWNAIRRIQGQSESHLDTIGVRQAVALGKRLADVPLHAAWVSSAQRTRETAERVLAGRDLPVHFRDDLREMRLGRWETLQWPDIEMDEPDEVARYQAFDDRFEVEGAERLSQMQRRGVEAIADIVAIERRDGADDGIDDGDHGDGHGRQIAIVSHGFLLRAILADMLDRPLPDFAGLGGLPNCAHSIVDVDAAGGGRVRTIDSLPPHEGLWAALFAPPAMTGATTEATTGAATDAAAERRATR